MNCENLAELDGKIIVVLAFWIEHFDGILAVKMTFITEKGASYFAVFENVSCINLSDMSYPFEIVGFEILDYTSRGYSKDTRFFVNDYENGQLSFYCEDFEIFSADR